MASILVHPDVNIRRRGVNFPISQFPKEEKMLILHELVDPPRELRIIGEDSPAKEWIRFQEPGSRSSVRVIHAEFATEADHSSYESDHSVRWNWWKVSSFSRYNNHVLLVAFQGFAADPLPLVFVGYVKYPCPNCHDPSGIEFSGDGNRAFHRRKFPTANIDQDCWEGSVEQLVEPPDMTKAVAIPFRVFEEIIGAFPSLPQVLNQALH
jgi:hypothetical protein